MLVSFLDDWVRRTGRPVTHAHSPGSAHHFYIAALDLMRAYPPVVVDEAGDAVRAAVRSLLPETRLQMMAPWDNVVRSAAGG